MHQMVKHGTWAQPRGTGLIATVVLLQALFGDGDSLLLVSKAVQQRVDLWVVLSVPLAGLFSNSSANFWQQDTESCTASIFPK